MDESWRHCFATWALLLCKPIAANEIDRKTPKLADQKVSGIGRDAAALPASRFHSHTHTPTHSPTPYRTLAFGGATCYSWSNHWGRPVSTGWLQPKLRAEESCLASLNTREKTQQPTKTWLSRPKLPRRGHPEVC